MCDIQWFSSKHKSPVLWCINILFSISYMLCINFWWFPGAWESNGDYNDLNFIRNYSWKETKLFDQNGKLFFSLSKIYENNDPLFYIANMHRKQAKWRVFNKKWDTENEFRCNIKKLPKMSDNTKNGQQNHNAFAKYANIVEDYSCHRYEFTYFHSPETNDLLHS